MDKVSSFEELAELTEELKKICVDAGAAIMDIYNAEDLGVEYKSDESPLTLADKAANEVICAGLEKLKFRFPIVSEENKEVPYEDRKDYPYLWLVDPLDGTKEFIKRNGEFTVNIALIHNHQPVMGFVYTPVTKDLYWAIKGKGAFHQSGENVVKMEIPPFGMGDKGLGVVCSRSHLNAGTEAFVNQLNEPVLVAKGSSLKFLIIAQGKAQLYPRLAPTMEWDTGAAQIVLEEAGGSVLQYEDQKPLAYNKPNLLNPHFVAYGRQN